MIDTPLPTGWGTATLGDIVSEGPTNGISGRSGEDAKGTLTLKLSATTSGDFIFNESTTKRLYDSIRTDARYWLKPGDLLIQRANSLHYLGAAAIYRGTDEPIVYPDLMMRVRLPYAILTEWLWRYLSTPTAKRYFRSVATGTAGNMPKINGSTLKSLAVPLAPIAEQKRIVTKLDALFSHSRKAKQALEAIPPLLERYRQSVLAAACSGRLTEAWRRENPDVEPAEKLLERIRVERRKRWEEDYLAKLAAKGKVPKNDKWKAKYKEPEPVDTEGLPELPEGWSWASLGLLATIQGGIQKSPKRRPAKNPYPFLRVANVHRGRLVLDEIHELELFNGEIDRLRLERGDLLIVEGNGSRKEIGRMAVWDASIANCIHQNHIIRARLLCDMLASYVELYWNSPAGAERVADFAQTTTGLFNLSVTKVSRLPVPVPGLREQKAIWDEYSRLLNLPEKVATLAKNGQDSLGFLESSFLSFAFQGRLIPQDPDDEPASILMERIKSQRETQKRKNRRKQ